MERAFEKLPRSFYDRDTALVARELLGRWLVHRDGAAVRVARIVETEAYLGPHDRASHSRAGLTARTRVMFGPPGHAYVYLVYGLHCCVNVVTERAGHGAAVLIRAVEPVRHVDGRATGPGLVCRAMGIDLRLNGCDLLGDTLFVAEPPERGPFRIEKSPRVGVAYAGAWARRLLRFRVARLP